MLLSIIIAVLLFGLLIFVHELGHFMTAKWMGVGINEFALGMGPRIISHTGKDGVVYALRLFPIGGFVSMVGEDEESNDENALNKKPLWKRFIVISAGSIMNLLLGFLVMLIIVTFSANIYSNTIDRLLVVDKSGQVLTEYQGIKPNDTIVKIGSKNINVQYDYSFSAIRQGAEPCDITILRDGKKQVIKNFVFPTMNEKGIVFGNPNFFVPKVIDKNIGSVLKQSFFQSISTIDMIWKSFIDLISGKYGAEAVSGPVGVVGEIGNSVQFGPLAIIFMLALITMNVGIFNLLPLPALDGGRLVFLLIELIRGKPVPPKYENFVHVAGLIILLLFMVFVTYNDIARIFTK